jgi:S1-C subfamily serine protease
MDEHQDETPQGTAPAAPATPPTEQPTPPTPPTPPTGQPQGQPFGQPFGQPLTPPPAQPRHRRGARIAVAGTLVLAVGLGGGVAIGHSIGDHSVAGSGTSGSAPVGQLGWGDPYGNGTGQGSGGFGNGSGGFGDGGSGSSSGAGTGTSREATDAESVGVVDITTVIDYGQAEAAGTGVVLTANGEILTNNHVVAGATKVTVTVVSTGQSYAAKVVGTDATDDVAVLQLSGASGLNTAKLSSDDVSVGDAVTAVGNAGGTGGTPTAATGTVTALNQSITASDEGGSDPEQLTGMIQVDADIQAGDSGGPLYDSDGEVVGIDTAASSGQSGSTVGFAIPIEKATSIADRIESGEDSATIQQGTPAFLGVQLAQDTTGAATISGVVDGSPAADAGLQAGDTITAVGGTTVDSADALSAALAEQDAGDQVRVTWVDSTGTSHTATITLVAGPAA